MEPTWEALYRSPAYGLWALLVPPVLFAAWLASRRARGHGVEPRADGFVRGWAAVFTLEAIVDLVATGFLGLPLLPFVLLGDYRVFVLVLGVAEPERARGAVLAEAAAWTLLVPIVAWGTHAVLARGGPLPETTLWLVYEAAFALLAGALAVWLVPRRTPPGRAPVRRYLRAVLAFVVLYYTLWALADVLILAGEDRGWALRMVPNHL